MSTTLPESVTDKIITDKIREWESQLPAAREDSARPYVHLFLTISRDFGCGEEDMVPRIERTLGWKVYGRNLLDHIAYRDYLSRSFIETLDEQRKSLMDDWITYLIHSGAILQNEYIVKLSKLMKVILNHESAIFLGRGAQYILAGKEEGIHIKLTAPLEYRIAHTASLRNISESAAGELVRRTDHERREFLRQHFHCDLEDTSCFDLVFNTRTVPADLICGTLLQMVELRTNRLKES